MLLLSPIDSYISSVDLLYDLIKGLLITLNRRSLKIQWLKPHAGIEGKKIVDSGAKSAHYKTEILEYPLYVF